MNQAIRFLFGSPQRVITTAFCGFAIWGIIDPQAVRCLIASCASNFWLAFGPLLIQLLQILIVVGVIWAMVRGLFKKGK